MTIVGLGLGWSGHRLDVGEVQSKPANFGQTAILWRKIRVTDPHDFTPYPRDPRIPAGTTGKVQTPIDQGQNIFLRAADVGRWPAPVFNQITPVNSGQLNQNVVNASNASFSGSGIAGSSQQDAAANAAAGAALLGGG